MNQNFQYNKLNCGLSDAIALFLALDRSCLKDNKHIQNNENSDVAANNIMFGCTHHKLTSSEHTFKYILLQPCTTWIIVITNIWLQSVYLNCEHITRPDAFKRDRKPCYYLRCLFKLVPNITITQACKIIWLNIVNILASGYLWYGSCNQKYYLQPHHHFHFFGSELGLSLRHNLCFLGIS